MDKTKLSKEETCRYRAFYCGLCRVLGERYANAGRMSLTFDMTFAAMLLSSLYNLEETSGGQRCVQHPLRSHPYVITPAAEYAADMNVFLAYYQALDDYHDDHNAVAGRRSRQLGAFLPDIKGRYPRQCSMIEGSLKFLSEMERNDEINPDMPANCFGRLMGEVFVWKEDEYSETLRSMGAALGRFIYLLDACNDLKADIKKQRYNPLVTHIDTDFESVLTMLIGECASEFEKLPLERDIAILRNVMYSGVWTKCYTKWKGDADEQSVTAGKRPV